MIQKWSKASCSVLHAHVFRLHDSIHPHHCNQSVTSIQPCDYQHQGWMDEDGQTGFSITTHLLLVRDKHFLGLLDHWLWLEVLITKAMLAWVKQLTAWHTGKYQVCWVGFKIHVHLNFFWINRFRSQAFLLYSDMWDMTWLLILSSPQCIGVDSTRHFPFMHKQFKIS